MKTLQKTLIALSAAAAFCALADQPPPSRAPSDEEVARWRAEVNDKLEEQDFSGGVPFFINRKEESHIASVALVMNDVGYFTGLQFALCYNTGGDNTGRVSSGLQFSLLANSWSGLEREPNKVPKLDGVQFSLLANMADDLHGAQIGFFFNSASFHGLQFAGFNVAEDSSGLQLGLLANNAKDHSGVQFSLFGNLATDIHGAQVALVLNQTTALDGFQFGLLNFTRDLDGTQIGLFNKATSGKGLQIGLVNIWDGSLGIPLVHAHF